MEKSMKHVFVCIIFLLTLPVLYGQETYKIVKIEQGRGLSYIHAKKDDKIYHIVTIVDDCLVSNAILAGRNCTFIEKGESYPLTLKQIYPDSTKKWRDYIFHRCSGDRAPRRSFYDADTLYVAENLYGHIFCPDYQNDSYYRIFVRRGYSLMFKRKYDQVWFDIYYVKKNSGLDVSGIESLIRYSLPMDVENRILNYLRSSDLPVISTVLLKENGKDDYTLYVISFEDMEIKDSDVLIQWHRLSNRFVQIGVGFYPLLLWSDMVFATTEEDTTSFNPADKKYPYIRFRGTDILETHRLGESDTTHIGND